MSYRKDIGDAGVALLGILLGLLACLALSLLVG